LKIVTLKRQNWDKMVAAFRIAAAYNMAIAHSALTDIDAVTAFIRAAHMSERREARRPS
jgi:hypothetical protein